MRRACVSLTLSLLLAADAFGQGTIQRARDAITPPAAWPPPAPSAPAPPKPSSNYFSDGLSSGSGEAVGGLILLTAAAATAPIWLPNLCFDEGAPGIFTSYPYAKQEARYALVGRTYDERRREQQAPYGSPDYLKTWSLRVAVEDGNDFAGLNRLGGHLFLDGPERFGFLSNINYFWEGLAGGRHDSTVLADYNLTFRFVQSGWLLMHAGVGVRHQIDRFDDQAGFNFVYRADVFPCRPLHVETTFAVGNLNHALVLEGRVGVGANWRQFQGFAGYNVLSIGGVTLQGPYLGLRVWF
jgi:hypothetical protein